MPGSTYGSTFTITTWGESHGKALGVVVDGCPAGLPLAEDDIQADLNRRRPGQNAYVTGRDEADRVEILSGVFEGKTTGTSISLLIRNADQRSGDYRSIAGLYRPGHADFGYDQKYGFRDYRGGGRSSGRETAARVAAGAVAKKILQTLNVSLLTYTLSIGDIKIDPNNFKAEEILKNPFAMPDCLAALNAETYVQEIIKQGDSIGGVIECQIMGLPPGVGEPVFDKLDANLAKAVLSVGGVKAVEFGLGFACSKKTGSFHNDEMFYHENNGPIKYTNHAGGILGGLSDGSPLVFRAAVKPTPSIRKTQKTVSKQRENVNISIEGRHDPVIVPRAVIVVEAMAAVTVLDLMLVNMRARMEHITRFYQRDTQK